VFRSEGITVIHSPVQALPPPAIIHADSSTSAKPRREI
jgi:hypothetical protein